MNATLLYHLCLYRFSTFELFCCTLPYICNHTVDVAHFDFNHQSVYVIMCLNICLCCSMFNCFVVHYDCNPQSVYVGLFSQSVFICSENEEQTQQPTRDAEVLHVLFLNICLISKHFNSFPLIA